MYSYHWQYYTLFNPRSLVIPELQRRGLFRNEYEGTTLRENLGLSRPVNQYQKVLAAV